MLTLGPAEAEEQLRDAMALGIDRAILLQPTREWDGAGDRRRDRRRDRGRARRRHEFDLILFGNESADTGNFQVGIRVAHALGLPCVTGVKGDHGGGRPCPLRAGAAGGRDVYDVRAAGGGDGEGGPQPAALPVGAGPAAGQEEAAGHERAAGPRARVEKLRLKLPPGPRQAGARSSATAPEPRPRCVEVLRGRG